MLILVATLLILPTFVQSIAQPPAPNITVQACDGGAVLTGTSGEITTPNYPDEYNNGTMCKWTIESSNSSVINLDFLDFALESDPSCSYDFINVFVNNEKVGGRPYCGNTSPRNFTTPAGSNVTIIFQSDVDVPAKGFLISWTITEACSDAEFTCWDGTCILKVNQCDKIRHCQDDSDEIECERQTSSYEECGISQMPPQFPWNYRIAGGSKAKKGSFPWQVLVLVGRFQCGGSIIADRWILTAAHCLEDAKDTTQIEVFVGSHSSNIADNAAPLRVAEMVSHEEYNNATLNHDIALLYLNTKIDFTATVRPVCWGDIEIPAGTICIATGWGNLYPEVDHVVLPNDLYQVRLPILKQSVCNESYGTLPTGTLCAGDRTRGVIDTCGGDSGGPLVCLVNETAMYLIGITSFGGSVCGDPETPGVYTKVAAYSDWINQTMHFYEQHEYETSTTIPTELSTAGTTEREETTAFDSTATSPTSSPYPSSPGPTNPGSPTPPTDERQTSSYEECGISQMPPQFPWNYRIAGGSKTKKRSFPWQVLVLVGRYQCGGSIVADRWILTAAHCLEDAKDTTQLEVYVGSHSSNIADNAAPLPVAEMVSHEEYNNATLNHDIALLYLNTKIDFTATVRSVCWGDVETPASTICIATGWGNLYPEVDHVVLPNDLYQVRLPILKQSVCTESHCILAAGTLCAGDRTRGVIDTCGGDSGGPLVCLVNETAMFLSGITSFGGSVYGDPEKPGVYTKVAAYSDWINQTIYVYEDLHNEMSAKIPAEMSTADPTNPGPPTPPTDGFHKIRTISSRLSGMLFIIAAAIVFLPTIVQSMLPPPEVNIITQACNGGVALTGTSGEITTPNYPDQYNNDTICKWTIESSGSSVINIDFLDFVLEDDTDCEFDFITVFVNNETIGGRTFCDSTSPRNFTTPPGSNVTITFEADSSLTAKGFRISWTITEGCTDAEFTCWDGTCIRKVNQCDGTRHCEDDSDEIECERSSLTFDECGKSDQPPQFPWNYRIVGGSKAKKGSFPWQALVRAGRYQCGGSIIADRWILTAAHCLEDAKNTTQVEVYVESPFTMDEFPDPLRVIQTISHQRYNSGSFGHDIALLYLDTKINFTATVRPVCWGDVEMPAGTVCIATGWGVLHPHRINILPKDLYQVRLPILKQSVCTESYGTVPAGTLCAGDRTRGGIDTCSGDSGGPLVCLVNETAMYLIGITSFGGSACGDPELPGVYTKVAAYSDWINQTMHFYEQHEYETTTTIPTELSTAGTTEREETTAFDSTATSPTSSPYPSSPYPSSPYPSSSGPSSPGPSSPGPSSPGPSIPDPTNPGSPTPPTDGSCSEVYLESLHRWNEQYKNWKKTFGEWKEKYSCN